MTKIGFFMVPPHTHPRQPYIYGLAPRRKKFKYWPGCRRHSYSAGTRFDNINEIALVRLEKVRNIVPSDRCFKGKEGLRIVLLAKFVRYTMARPQSNTHYKPIRDIQIREMILFFFFSFHRIYQFLQDRAGQKDDRTRSSYQKITL